MEITVLFEEFCGYDPWLLDTLTLTIPAKKMDAVVVVEEGDSCKLWDYL